MIVHSSNPNIFMFATSELTQDAFLCWVLDGLNYPDCEIYPFARGFLDMLLQQTTDQVHMMHDFSSSDVYGVEIARQANHIDILATLKIRNGYGERTQKLIIEDKTFTSPHSNQLVRYREQHEHDKPICIYYKTGFLFNEHEYARHYGYASIHKHNMIHLMRKYANRIKSDIFMGYYGYLLQLQDEEEKIVSSIHRFINEGTGEIDKALERSEGQFMLMQLLMKSDSVITDAGKADSPSYIFDKITRGQNRDGSPWTQYTLLFFQGSEAVTSGAVDDVFEDEIFYRIDRKNKGYYISLRQYNKTGFNNEKLEHRLPKLRQCFDKACQTVQNNRRKVAAMSGEPSGFPRFESPGNRGRFESEIALYYISDGRELGNLCELMSEINEQFLLLVRNEF